jgi:pyridinium-3,5-bisthiocarboxylic acid mononucleotide nickel chelatase
MTGTVSRILYFDCFSGVSGDMVLGALVDLGVDIKDIRAGLKSLDLKGYRIEATVAKRGGITGTKVNVKLTKSKTVKQPSRHFSDIKSILKNSRLPEIVKKNSLHVFDRIAIAEAEVHGISKEKIHFHEVGAIDSIIDVVGSAFAIHILAPDSILASPLNVGEGFVECMHGTLPVPAPATLKLLKDIPCFSSGVQKEMTTPTGAALMGHFSERFGSMPTMKIIRAGYGAGDHIIEKTPNLLRVVSGETFCLAPNDTVQMIEANIDDMNPEFYDCVFENLFKAGVLDVFLTPILMKKNRPANKISVLVNAKTLEQATHILLTETSTLGVRHYPVDRTMLDRQIRDLITPMGKVRVKIGRLGSEILRITPEYEDCKKIARSEKRPLQSVYQEVSRLANSLDWD